MEHVHNIMITSPCKAYSPLPPLLEWHVNKALISRAWIACGISGWSAWRVWMRHLRIPSTVGWNKYLPRAYQGLYWTFAFQFANKCDAVNGSSIERRHESPNFNKCIWLLDHLTQIRRWLNHAAFTFAHRCNANKIRVAHFMNHKSDFVKSITE